MKSGFTQRALRVLGSLLKTARRDRTLSQTDIAERAGVTRQTIIAIEKGDPKVSVGTVFEVAHLLGIPLLSKDDEILSKWQSILSDFSGLLPKRVRHKKFKVSDDF